MIMASLRNLNVPLQNGGIATFPVPMTPADHVLLTTILGGLKSVHVRAPCDSGAETMSDNNATKLDKDAPVGE